MQEDGVKLGFRYQFAIVVIVLTGVNQEVLAQVSEADSAATAKRATVAKVKRHKRLNKVKLPDDSFKKSKEFKVFEIKTIPEGAAQLLVAIQSGKLTLTNGDRDREQLKTLAKSGSYLWPTPNPPRVVSRLPNASVAKRLPTSQFDDSLQENPFEMESGTTGSPSNQQLGSNSGFRSKRGISPSRHAPPGMRIGAFGPSDEHPAPTSFVVASPLSVSCSPSLGLLKMLTAFSSRSTSAKPLELMSLLRPPYRTSRFAHAGPRNPHSCGLAADIAAYGGLRIRQSHPKDCVQAFIKMIDDLPVGKYRVGAPKAPDTMMGIESFSDFLADALPLEATPASLPEIKKKTRKKLKAKFALAKTIEPNAPNLIVISALRGAYDGNPADVWPFFPAPSRETVFDIDGKKSTKTLFANESYAPEAALASARVRAALARARRRGVDVVALFPDAADHVHIDVRDR